MALPPSSRNPTWLSAEMKYVIEESPLQEGRFCKVHKAKEVGTDKVLAVKVFNKLAAEPRERERRRAIRHESSMLAAVRQGVSITVRQLYHQTHSL
jgi:hypothetical protein